MTDILQSNHQATLLALRASEISYRRLFEAAQDGILILDADTGRINDVNPFLINLLGFTADEMIGKTVGELSPFKDIESNKIMLERLQKTGYVRYEDLPLETRDGRRIAVEFVSNVYQAGDKKVIQCNIRDISERKRKDETDKRLAAIVDNSDDAIISKTLSGVITSWNPAAEKMFGYTASEIIGQPLQVLIPPDCPKEEAEILAGFARGEFVRHLETVRVRKNGERFDVSVTISPIMDFNGKIVGASKIVRDITERKRASALLMESRQRLALATESAKIGIWDWNVTANKMVWDKQMYELYGTSEKDFSGAYDAWQTGLFSEDRDRTESSIAAALDGSRDFHTEFRIMWPNDQVHHIEAHGLVQRTVDGSAKRMIGVNWDITARKQAEIRINYLNRVYAVLSGINTLIARVSDRDELFKEACRIAVEAGGFCMAWIGIVDQGDMRIIPVASSGMDEKLLTAISDTMSLSADRTPPRNNMASQAIREKRFLLFNNLQDNPTVGFGKQHAEFGVLSMAILPLIVADKAIGVLTLCASEVEFFHEEEVKLLTELAGDISFAIDHLGNQEKLLYLAYHDPLTGLANRTLLLDRLTQAIRRARNENFKVALMFGDIKGFRQINETMGREVGDMVLRIFADRLKKVASEPENVARINSDYFAGIVSNFTDVKAFAQRMNDGLREVMGAPYVIDNKTFNLSTRLGVAVFPLDGDDADTLFKNAEAALLKAKKSGDKYLFYQPEMNAQVADKLHLEQKLRMAIEKEEFILYYQPKINTIDGKISGLEALIRWNDPDNGIVPPLKFIPLLEETGMIMEVGAWAIRKALADHRDWTGSGLQPPRIAVNVSAIQLHQKDFVNMVRDAFGDKGDAVHGLDLEITESLIMENIEDNIQKLKMLRDMGINIAIDDFGTGYSSLGYLTRLPVDTIKIDHSFVIKMTEDADSMTIVAAIISLAHALNLKVVAEGVETEEHARFLKLLKCDELQGYFYSKPLLPEGISNLLKAASEKADLAKRNPVPHLVV